VELYSCGHFPDSFGVFMAKKAVALPTVANEIYGLLEPLQPADRMKAINAALTLLGDPPMGAASKFKLKEDPHEDHDEIDVGEVSAKGKAWMRKYKVTANHLGEVFDLDSETVEIIADDVPGKTAKEKTINAYVITGIGQYLKTGDVVFKDNAARAVCKHIGCLNTANHSNYMDSRKNYFGGTKKAGWKMTAPGLKRGAELIAAMVGGGE
jgi:hypothetical protein